MDDLISTSELRERYGRSTRTLNHWQREKGFPAPIMRGGHGSESRWRVRDVIAWEEKRAAA